MRAKRSFGRQLTREITETILSEKTAQPGKYRNLEA